MGDVPYGSLIKSVDDCGCGCGKVGTLKAKENRAGIRCVKGCGCQSCRNRNNRKRGLTKQRNPSTKGKHAMDEKLEAAQVLDDAADLLLMNGRCIFDGAAGLPGSERYCVLGAMAQVAKEDADEWTEMGEHPATAALAARLRPTVAAWSRENWGHWNRHASPPRHDIEVVYTWNDGVIGDKVDDGEVIDTLRSVAKELRREVHGG